MGFLAQRKIRKEFEEHAIPHTDALYGTALRLTRNPRDAEDLVQDTLLRAYRFWHTFETGTNCKSWLFKILSNTFINRYHKGRRDREIAQQLADAGADLTADILSHEVTESSRDPEGALASRLLSDDVVRALEALPTDFRLAVLLCDVEEFSYKEIAEIMECPVGTVMSRLFRARRMLQRTLHEYAVEQGIIKPVVASADDPIDLVAYRNARKPGNGAVS
jgi:RNA polymerase sigma-70 factor, ECF subfamily